MQSKKNMINDHACSPSSIVMKFVNFQIPWSTSTHETHISITLLRRRKHDDEKEIEKEKRNSTDPVSIDFNRMELCLNPSS